MLVNQTGDRQHLVTRWCTSTLWPECATILDNTFPRRWIGRRGAVEWPARSPDFNSLDYFFWGHMKNLDYQTKPNVYSVMNKWYIRRYVVLLVLRCVAMLDYREESDSSSTDRTIMNAQERIVFGQISVFGFLSEMSHHVGVQHPLTTVGGAEDEQLVSLGDCLPNHTVPSEENPGEQNQVFDEEGLESNVAEKRQRENIYQVEENTNQNDGANVLGLPEARAVRSTSSRRGRGRRARGRRGGNHQIEDVTPPLAEMQRAQSDIRPSRYINYRLVPTINDTTEFITSHEIERQISEVKMGLAVNDKGASEPGSGDTHGHTLWTQCSVQAVRRLYDRG
ncbi:hypothetical protein J6590_085337 [Homalodisca vitripennis]|nr:hypothetical protein J6590_085337 [Homalodisca vitripennis]